ncbi:hypothetical protein FI667_g9342, partial [Globisporangium splendens]
MCLSHWAISVATTAVAALLSSVAAESQASYSTSASSWRFTPVTSVQVRVQGNLPVWDAKHKAFVASFGNTFEEKYRSVLDTVNMAAVEGAFKYVQAECINQDVIVNCTRKNDIKYVVFYETTIVQPRTAMAFYQNDRTGEAAIEHCPFVAMDGGQCTPTNGVLPKECDQYLGVNGQPKLGMCVGGQLQDQELLAPYPNNYWFSYPSSCPTKVWNDKTDACRGAQPGGLCPFGVKPDGITCSFSYEILGWVKLDDVVGITKMQNPLTNKTYADYAEFCQAGGVEFNAVVRKGNVLVKETLSFWKNPTSPSANAARSQVLVDAYSKTVKTNPRTPDGGIMKLLPTIASLKRKNPPCYKNNVQCAKALFGCRRRWYSQICEVCRFLSFECEMRPLFYRFPQL